MGAAFCFHGRDGTWVWALNRLHAHGRQSPEDGSQGCGHTSLSALEWLHEVPGAWERASSAQHLPVSSDVCRRARTDPMADRSGDWTAEPPLVMCEAHNSVPFTRGSGHELGRKKNYSGTWQLQVPGNRCQCHTWFPCWPPPWEEPAGQPQDNLKCIPDRGRKIKYLSYYFCDEKGYVHLSIFWNICYNTV